MNGPNIYRKYTVNETKENNNNNNNSKNNNHKGHTEVNTISPYMIQNNPKGNQLAAPYYLHGVAGDGHRVVAQRAYAKKLPRFSLHTRITSNDIFSEYYQRSRANQENSLIKYTNNFNYHMTNSGENNKNGSVCFKNDYSNHYIQSGIIPVKFIRNALQPVDGYPKLQRLHKLKEEQVKKHSLGVYGSRVKSENVIETLNKWVYEDNLTFDVIMIGALAENQLFYPLLSQLPIDKLCSKPGFLFIWASTQKISELSRLFNDESNWTKKFRRSEELVFIPVDKNSAYYPSDSIIQKDQLLEKMQWHCWMCITGTVRRSTDKNLIHCNVNTDIVIENENTVNSSVPKQIYQVAENFSSSVRRLHIIPSSTGLDHPVKLRPGWVIMSPDVILDNFDPVKYKKEVAEVGTNIPYNEEIEMLRPKSRSDL